ncbi:MAG TPA: Vps62-related protein [Thermoleophilaceae bacterium]
MIAPIFKLNTTERWRPQPVETVEKLGTIADGPIDLNGLPDAGGRMNFPPDMKDPTNTPVVGYHRSLRKANLWWHQFWLWYLYNPWEIAGFGKHEGDWEFVQLGCTDKAGDKPVLVTASQHKTGEKREYWRCELIDGRPVIYVALGSHANYFTPGDRGEDVANGRGKVYDEIDWRDFGDWATWPGMWGNSTGAGRSPDSPGSQRERWELPHVYHARAR